MTYDDWKTSPPEYDTCDGCGAYNECDCTCGHDEGDEEEPDEPEFCSFCNLPEAHCDCGSAEDDAYDAACYERIADEREAA